MTVVAGTAGSTRCAGAGRTRRDLLHLLVATPYGTAIWMHGKPFGSRPNPI